MLAKSLFVASFLLAIPSSAKAGDPPANDEAKRAFSAGVILLKDPDGAKYEEALSQFNKAYRLSGSWKVLGNIGLCSLKLERDGEAIAAYEKYLAQGGKEIDGDERKQVENDLAALRAQLVRVHLAYPVGGSTLTDERTSVHGARLVNDYPAGPTSADLGLHPGQHVITLRFSSGDAKWTVKLEPGTSVSHTFESPAAPARAADEPHGARTAGWIVGGAGVVGLGVGAFFGLKSFSKNGDSDAHCDGKLCDQTGLDLRDEARSAAMISNVAFAAGLAGVGVGTYLILFGGRSGSNAGSGLVLRSTMAARGAGVEFGGSW